MKNVTAGQRLQRYVNPVTHPQLLKPGLAYLLSIGYCTFWLY